MPFLKRDRPEVEELTGQRWVPVLVLGDEVIHDSHRILEYLETDARAQRPGRDGGGSRPDGLRALAGSRGGEGALQAAGARVRGAGAAGAWPMRCLMAAGLALAGRSSGGPREGALPARQRRCKEGGTRRGRAAAIADGPSARTASDCRSASPGLGLVQPVLEPDALARRLGLLDLALLLRAARRPAGRPARRVSNISMTMSQPPTSSPLTKSWGIVGQPESPDSSSRMRGSGRMSSAAYLDAEGVERARRPGREPARRLVRRALHEEHHLVLLDRVLDEAANLVVGHAAPPGVEVLIESAWIGPPISAPNTS